MYIEGLLMFKKAKQIQIYSLLLVGLIGCSVTKEDIVALSDQELMERIRTEADPRRMPPYGPIRTIKLDNIELMRKEARMRFDKMPLPVRDALLEGRVLLGMTSNLVLLAKGKPDNINRTTTLKGSSEQWVYRFPQTYIYLNNGIVTAVQD